MNRIQNHWPLPVAGMLLLTAATAGAQNTESYGNATNRLTLSLRFGLNISGKFTGTGRSFTTGTPLAAGRKTPNGDPYNYDNGYVLTDISGNAGGMTYYWGYDSASQIHAGDHAIAFDHTLATGLPSENTGDDSPYIGVELTYNHQFGQNEARHLNWGAELAVNYLPISFRSGGRYNASLTRTTDNYGYESGTTPPTDGLPYTGGYAGGNFLLNSSPSSSVTTIIPGATFLVQQQFDANLWGLRLGPYLEWNPSERWSLHLTGGLAVGLIDAQASWHETLILPGGAGDLTASGSGRDMDVLFGYYVGLSAGYQLSERWGLAAGVQLQDLGIYQGNFGGRTAELDLSGSIFIHAGLSYRF